MEKNGLNSHNRGIQAAGTGMSIPRKMQQLLICIFCGTSCTNPADHEPYNSGKRKVFNGLGLAIIQAGKVPGKVTLTASTVGMGDAEIDIYIIK